MNVDFGSNHMGVQMVAETTTSAAIARAWWAAIDRGDFTEATRLCAPSAEVQWPLSNERMTSIEHWRLVNQHYPGTWRATITELIAQGDAVATVARVFDDKTAVTAISFFTIGDGMIQKIVEYWPEPYEAPEWRSQWITPLT